MISTGNVEDAVSRHVTVGGMAGGSCDARRQAGTLPAGKAPGGLEDYSLAALSILRLSNDHTSGLAPGKPSPQFYVADNDYALGRLVEAVSHSPYWKDTAVVAVEDDAQDGP